MQRVGDHHRIESFLTGTALSTTLSMLNLVIFSFVLLRYSPAIFLIFIVGSILYLLWIQLFLRYRRQLDYKRFALSARENNATMQLVYGVQEIKLNNAETSFRWAWEGLQAGLFKLFLQENQQLKQGQTICFINPGNSNYYIEAVIPQYNFGKVKTGQEVLLKFQAYPYPEFGSVKGTIDFISNAPSDSGYLAKIVLPQGLTTNYQKNLQYRTGLSLQAEIITDKRSLLERFFSNFRSKLK